MSQRTSFRRLAASLSALGALLALGPVGIAYAVESAAPSDQVLISAHEIGGPVTVAGRPPPGIYDAGPTPPNAGDPPPTSDPVDPEPPADAEDPERERAPNRSADSAEGDVSRQSLDSPTGSGNDDGANEVDAVPLARTGFPALALASLGGLSLLAGLCLLGLRRV